MNLRCDEISRLLERGAGVYADYCEESKEGVDFHVDLSSGAANYLEEEDTISVTSAFGISCKTEGCILSGDFVSIKDVGYTNHMLKEEGCKIEEIHNHAGTRHFHIRCRTKSKQDILKKLVRISKEGAKLWASVDPGY